MNIAICGADGAFQDELRQRLFSYCGSRRLPLELFEYTDVRKMEADRRPVDIAFFNELPGPLYGIEAAREFKKRNPRVILIITAEDSKRIDDAFDIKAFRYFEKPVETQRLFASLDCAVKRIDESTVAFVHTHTGEMLRIPAKKIVFVETSGRKTWVVTENAEYSSAFKISQWKKMLRASCFAFPHSSYIVNMRYVESFARSKLTLKYPHGEYEVPVSANRQAEFKLHYLLFNNMHP